MREHSEIIYTGVMQDKITLKYAQNIQRKALQNGCYRIKTIINENVMSV